MYYYVDSDRELEDDIDDRVRRVRDISGDDGRVRDINGRVRDISGDDDDGDDDENHDHDHEDSDDTEQRDSDDEDVVPGALTSDCEVKVLYSDDYCKFHYSDVINNKDYYADEHYSDVINNPRVVNFFSRRRSNDGIISIGDYYADSEHEEDFDGVQGIAGGEDIGDDDDEDHDHEDSDDSEQGDSDDEEDSTVSEEDSDNSEVEEDVGGAEDGDEEDEYNHLNHTIGSSRGLYSLLTGKTYIIDLPEAAGRLILATNKGWLVTLGRDLQVNLLHPLLRRQIPLPSMLEFPRHIEYDEDYQPEEASNHFIWKVAMSSNILNKNTAFGLYHPQASPSPIVMAIYGECQYLGFARLRDKVWTDVNVPLNDWDLPSHFFNDIAYHKGNFYAVDSNGAIFVCSSDNNEEGGDIRARKIAQSKTKEWLAKYLVESSSGSDLLLLVRYRKHKGEKYRTTNFAVWRLDLNYSDSFEDITCTLKRLKYLENEAIFVGRASSVAVSSSETIKTNSIYFTDDDLIRCHKECGHDMGIFNMEHHTMEPHFEGKSIHPISPPLWYF